MPMFMKKNILIILTLSLFCSTSSFALGMRNAYDVVLGLTGSIGFPQIGQAKNGTDVLKATKGKFATFGILTSFFYTDSSALTLTVSFDSKKIDYSNKLSLNQKYTTISLSNDFFIGEIFFIGLGAFATIPVATIKDEPETFISKAVSGGAQLTLGADVKILPMLAFRAGARLDIPFSKSNIKNHELNYDLYSMPISLVLALELVI